MKLLILTTALNRSGLHRQTFQSFKKILSKKDHITWLINIDRIEALDENVGRTEKRIRNLMSKYPNIDFKFFYNTEGTGAFNKAVRKLVNESKKYIEDADAVLYLEDDYDVKIIKKKFNLRGALKFTVGNNLQDSDFIISLFHDEYNENEKYLTFQPQLWSKNLFKGFIKVYDKVPNRGVCPEWLLKANYQKFTNLSNATFEGFRLFNSAKKGRAWLRTKGLVKVYNTYVPLKEIHFNRMLRIGRKFDTDKISKHKYYEIYPTYIERFYEGETSMIEVGVHTGESLRMWLELFPKMYVYGIEKDWGRKGKRYQVFKGDQSSEDDLRRISKKIIRPVSFIIDDGSHIPEHQLLTFNKLFPILVNNGVYIIEDIETSYWRKGAIYDYKTRYGYGHPNSIVEIFKNAVDSVNSHIVGVKTDVVKHQDYIKTITFAKNCIIIVKGRRHKDKEKYSRRQHLEHE